MSHISFNHIFMALMLLSALAAFVAKPSFTNRLRGQADGLFLPVAYPMQRLGHAIGGSRPAANTALPGEPTRQMIDGLAAEVASLTVQLEELQRINALRDMIGSAREHSRLFKVIGSDTGQRESLSIEASSGEGAAVGMPALCEHGVVGRLTAVGSSASQLQLITDRGFRVTGLIGSFVPTEQGRHVFRPAPLPPPLPPLVEGRGGGRMVILNLHMKQLQDGGVKVGDWVVLDDREDWPLLMQGRLLGQIERIEEQPRAPLFAQITVCPRINLRQLREVMVITGN